MRTLKEFTGWWRLQGRSPRVADDYCAYLAQLAKRVPLDEATLADVIEYVADAATVPTQRQRGRATKAYYRWANDQEAIDAPWFKRIPVIVEKATPQPTVTPEQVDEVLRSIKGNGFTACRDRAIVAVLWASGVRRSELVKLKVTDVGEGFLSVLSAKNARPRLAPLSPMASTALLKYLRLRDRHAFTASPALWLGERGALSACGVREALERRGSPSCHSFRRGWCVNSLRLGVSQASVQSAAGWTGPAMVSRYSATLAHELSMDEFSRAWGK